MNFVRLLVVALLLVLPVQAQDAVPVQAGSGSDAAVEDLVRILEDDTARAALIERLRQAAPVSGEATAPASEAEAVPDLSIVRRVAEYTKSVAEGASASLNGLAGAWTNLQRGWGAALSADYSAMRDLLVNLALVGAGLFSSFWVLRAAVFWIDTHLARRLGGGTWLRRGVAAFFSTLVDLAAVLLAWGLGYIIALSLVGNSGQMGINQSLLLNAFLVVEVIKLVIRSLLSPRFEPMRLVPVSDEDALYWRFWLARVVSLVGYTFLFLAPFIGSVVSRSAAASLQVLVMATAVTIGIVVVLQNKDDVRDWLNELAERRLTPGLRQVVRVGAGLWHVLAIIYLVALLLVWFTNPDRALPFMLGATGQSLVAIVIGSVVTVFISRFVNASLELPAEVKQRLPLLEARLRAFVPKVMAAVRWIVIVGVLAVIVQAWSVFDVAEWIGSDAGLQAVGAVAAAGFIILACIVLHVVVASWVEYRLNPSYSRTATPREKTLLKLFKNAFTVALVVFGLMLALAQIGVNIAPLLAGAGVVGLAIGFGAQKLVQDIITGIFIQFENVMNEGDVVAVGDKSGVVEKLTIRSVTIRDLGGTVHLIPFSSVDQVSNMVRGFSFHVAEFGVAYDSDIAEVKQALRDAFARLMETEHKDDILDDLDMQGVIAFRDSSITVRARIKTLPGKHWATGRTYSEIVKTVFAERGIEIPYPHVTYVSPESGRRNKAIPPDRVSRAPDAEDSGE